MLSFELVVKGLGIMIVDKHERGSGREFVNQLEDLHMPLSWNETAHVNLIGV